jgi:hypothetical protein
MTTMRNPFEFSKSISVATGFLCLALATGCSNKADEKMAEDVAAIRAIKEKEAASKDEQLAKQKRNQAMREQGASMPLRNIPESGR